MQYADRVEEYDRIIQLAESGVRAIFVQANEAVGITSFLKIKFANFRMIYIDCSENNSFLFAMLNQFSTKERKKLQKKINKKYGHREKLWFASIFSIIPYVGGFISSGASSFAAGKKAFSIGDIDTEDALKCIMPEFIDGISKDEQVYIALDHSQTMTSKEADEAIYLAENTSATFIFVISSKDNEIYKIKSNFSNKNISFDNLSFPIPSVDLVMELSRNHGKILSPEEADEIIQLCGGNIYKIREYVETGRLDYENAHSAIESGIVAICEIYHLRIEKSKLFAILSTSRELIIDLDSFRDAVNRLAIIGIIEDDGDSVIIVGANHPITTDIRNNNIDRLFYQKLVYEYLASSEPSSLHDFQLLYVLSLDYDSFQSNKWLALFILNSMKNQLSLDKNLVERLTPGNYSALRIVAYTYMRDYARALNDIEKYKKSHMLSKDLQKLYAILLNRCRKHKKAEECLLECLDKNNDNIVATFLISNYVHQEKLSEAKQFMNNYVKVAPSNNLGYVYRNAAAIDFNDLKYFEKALGLFEKDKDEYGYFTTLCNYAIRKSLINDSAQCEKDLLMAKDYLERFNQSDLHIIYNNLGLYYMMRGRGTDAEKYLEIAELKSGTLMPRIFSQINHAALFLKQGHYKESKELFDKISITEAKVDRIRQKYYANKLLIYYANGLPLETVLGNAIKHPDRYDGNYTKEMVNFYKNRIDEQKPFLEDDFDNLFCPCYLEYWYVNPLKIIDGNIDKVLSIHA